MSATCTYFPYCTSTIHVDIEKLSIESINTCITIILKEHEALCKLTLPKV